MVFFPQIVPSLHDDLKWVRYMWLDIDLWVYMAGEREMCICGWINIYVVDIYMAGYISVDIHDCI